MIDFVGKLKPAGASHLAEACKRFALATSPARACAWCSAISSTKAATKTACAMWPAANTICSACRCLSPQEIEPDLQGDLKLRDIEDDDMAEVSITAAADQAIQGESERLLPGLKDYITRRGGTYLFTSTAVPFDTLVLNYLRERGLLG